MSRQSPRRCRIVVSMGLAVGFGAGWTIAPEVRGATPLTTTRVASGMNRPLFVTAPPGDTSRLFIVEKRGVIRILNIPGNTLNGTAFLDIDALVFNPTGNNDERGLLGMAFHPDYASNGYFYVNYVNISGNTVIARYTRSAGDPNLADSASAMQILSIAQPYSNHNGGWLAFGPDGYLYDGQGDGGFGCDPEERAQNLSLLLGKMLRIDVNGDDFPGDATKNYAIPPSNPFAGATPGADEIWAYGLRNPWRNCFDRLTNDLYIADVGQSAREELDFQPAGSAGGQNYGWDCREGTRCTSPLADCGTPPGDTNSGCNCLDSGFTEPFYEYIHDGATCSITGGYVYRGSKIPDLQGTYFFADFCSNQIWSLRYNGASVSDFTERTTELAPGGGLSISGIVSFGEDAAGELYIVEQGGLSVGEVFKIIVNCAGSSLSFSQQPSNQIVCTEGNAMFSVAVSGLRGAVTYDWRRGGVSLGAPNSATLSLTNVQLAQAGSYDCVVTDQCHTTTSNPATLTVYAGGTGDLNGDGLENGEDVRLFVSVIINNPAGPAGAAFCAADFDHDGDVDGADQAAMVSLLLQ